MRRALPAILSAAIIATSFAACDDTIAYASQSAPSYTARGLLASAIDSIAARG